MADFNQAFRITLANEGGYVNDPDDSGGVTYKGISRKFHPNWTGWSIIDSMKNTSDFPAVLNSNQSLQDEVGKFYKSNFWDKVEGDTISIQSVADSIFDFAVNAGIKTSSKLAQEVAGTNPDGIIGPNSIKSINAVEEDRFKTEFALQKVKYYVQITEKTPTNQKFFFGWIRRTIKDL